MLMVAEITGTISLLAPAMIAVGVAWFSVKRTDDTIYRSQLKNRADSPAERLLTGMPVLRAVPIRQADWISTRSPAPAATKSDREAAIERSDRTRSNREASSQASSRVSLPAGGRRST
jgi:hypothetical protein